MRIEASRMAVTTNEDPPSLVDQKEGMPLCGIQAKGILCLILQPSEQQLRRTGSDKAIKINCIHNLTALRAVIPLEDVEDASLWRIREVSVDNKARVLSRHNH